MADRKEAREALAADLRAVADDLKALAQDPKKRKRKERRWGALYGAIALVTTLAGRRLAAKAWGILTGEQPPARGAAAASGTSRSETQLSGSETHASV
jgi:hypothetical protein